MAEEKDDKPIVTLELPPGQEPVVGGPELFAKDSLAVTSSRLHIAEAFLRLASKDCKFTDFIREVLLTAMKVVKSDAGSIFELDPKTNMLFFRSVAGASSEKVSGFEIPMGSGIVGFVAESRQPLVVSDAAENKIHLKKIDDVVGFKTRNLVALPILVRGQLYGVMELLNRVGDSTYTQQDVELLTYCADMAAKALEIRFMIAWALKGEAA